VEAVEVEVEGEVEVEVEQLQPHLVKKPHGLR
jgi:hypothetical protein